MLACRAARRAEAERFAQPRLHRELFDAIRFDVGWQQGCDEGLPPGALEVEAPLRAPFALLRHERVRPVARALGLPALLGLRAAWWPCVTAPHLALIVAPPGADDARALDAQAFHAGRSMQRVWLAAELAGVALQPMAALGALLRQDAGGGWVGAGTQRALRQQALRLLEAAALDTGSRLHLLLRLGRAPAPSVVASRPEVERLLPAQEDNALYRARHRWPHEGDLHA